MYSSRLPRVTAATPALMVAVVLCFTAGNHHPLGAQQAQSATTPTLQTERHGYGYGVASVVVPTTAAPLPPVSGPAQQIVAQNDAASVHLDQLMTLREWDATGVARLRPDERTALESWVQKYRSELLDGTSRTMDVDPSAPTVGSNSEAAPQAEPQPAASPAPVAAYPGAYTAPTAPAYVTPTPQVQPAYSPPAYATTAPISGNAGQAMRYEPPAPSAPYAYPSQGAISQPTPPSYQPSYQPQPVAPPQPAAPPVSTQGYASSPAYAVYPQPTAPQAPVSPIPAPAVQYPTALSGPAQGFLPQPLAPMMAPQYSVTVIPAAPPAPAGAVVKTGLAVKSVQGGNRFVSLTDGSMWDVYGADRGEAGVWRAQDPVYVRLATTSVSGGYDREIVNATRNVLIRVKFAGQLDK